MAISLLQIIEKHAEEIRDALADDLMKTPTAGCSEFSTKQIQVFAWTHVDAVLQSLRCGDDQLYFFFLDYASSRDAEQGLPLQRDIVILNCLRSALWNSVVLYSNAETLTENMLTLSEILSKGKDGIATSFLEQREHLLRELRQSNVQIIRNSHQKLEFLAKISHELKTPLTSIIAYSEQLLDESITEANRHEFTQVVNDQSNRLMQLIDDLIDLSWAENKQIQLDLSWVNPRKVIAEAIATVRVRAEEKEISLDVAEVAMLPDVFMDPLRIQQVLWNLFANAVKYNKRGGWTRISATRRGSEIVVTVADGGIGIKKEDLERIFESFQQVGEGRMLQAGSAGLGLGIVRQFVQLHGGSIWVESSPGQGSSFHFSLPIEGPAGYDSRRNYENAHTEQDSESSEEAPQV
jgi:signal transduction histidine kinase